jgi:hypothetical protein
MRCLLATLALSLLTACCATAATTDTVTRPRDDYAYGVQAVGPLKAKLDPKVITRVTAAHTISGPFCAFDWARAHYATAMADWARAS